jgi:hypothetical protein
MSALRPLPPRPSLEFEHKQAKALLRRLRAGDADALTRARAQHSGIGASTPARIKLADAQLVIAREYGFASWPRLVRYFREAERPRYHHSSIFERDDYEAEVRRLIAQHRHRRNPAGRALAAYVPRFYGLPLDDVFNSTVMEDEARLAVARNNGFPSWELLLERAAAEARRCTGAWEADPSDYARKAIEAGDLAELERLVASHPELRTPLADEGRRPTLLGIALHFEKLHGVAAMRPVMDWLAANGFDRQLALNFLLCGHIRMRVDEVQDLLDRGADPNWIAPNGIPVLEHALLRYWNGEAVDVLTTRVVPRTAFWIAAGLGDVDGVRHFLDRDGRPTPAARRSRPNFDAVFRLIPQHPDPDDEEILMEAFMVAMLNGRTRVLDYMLKRGFPVNSLVYGSPVINFAVGNAMTPIVESMIRGGADLDIKGWSPQQTAREMARELFEMMPEATDRRRIVELCGMDPDAILAERDARPVNPPEFTTRLQDALDLAADDAFRLGQSDIRPENLLFGLLRQNRALLDFFTRVSRMDLDRFRADVKDRMRSAEDRVERRVLPMHPDAQVVIEAATAIAAGRRRDSVDLLHLLYALTRPDGVAANLLARYGATSATLDAQLERGL